MSGEGDRGGAIPPASAASQRPLPLSILLALIVGLNALGEIKGWTQRDELMRAIPKLTASLFGLWASAPPIAIAGAAGLWFFRRWGLYLLGISWALAVAVDVIIGATNHAFLATGVMWLVVLFSRPIRSALR